MYNFNDFIAFYREQRMNKIQVHMHIGLATSKYSNYSNKPCT